MDGGSLKPYTEGSFLAWFHNAEKQKLRGNKQPFCPRIVSSLRARSGGFDKWCTVRTLARGNIWWCWLEPPYAPCISWLPDDCQICKVLYLILWLRTQERMLLESKRQSNSGSAFRRTCKRLPLMLACKTPGQIFCCTKGALTTIIHCNDYLEISTA